MSIRRRAPAALAVVALAAAPVAIAAQQAPDCVAAARAFTPVAVVGQSWPTPLDRVVRLGAAVLPLRDALALVASRASLRLSYSPDLLPLDRAVCVPEAELTAGAALAGLLDGVGVAPVIAGADQVVLAPTRTAAGASAAAPLAMRPGRLERVVVTGTATGAPERGSPLAVAVIEGAALERASGVQSAAQLLDAAVPGVWMWAQSPTSPLARYGSVRGASSFGLSAPKVYIDGIEMANPLLLAQIDAGRVQRIEVIRGPQGAALYGADAISGVVNIVTRHETGAPGAAGEIASTVGATSSDFASNGVLAQSHAATVRLGTGARSGSIGGSATTMGAFVPGASSRQLAFQGEARRVGAWTVATGIARWYSLRADAPASPLLAAIDSTSGRESLNAYTLGSTVTITPSARWTHAITAGIDGYRLAGLPSDGIPAPSQSDSALRAARGGADRATLRLSSTASGGDPAVRVESLTIALEHSTAREQTNAWGSRIEGHMDGGGPGPGGMTPTSEPPSVAWWSNTGLLAQGQLGLRNTLFLSGGTRLEHISVPGGGSEVALLPMLGSAWVRDVGAATLKLRGAYGRGIRPARTVARGGSWMDDRYGTLVSLSPEEQSGIEIGADLLWGSWGGGGLHATRYDQRASGLVQPVAIWSQDTTSGPREHHMAYQLQNVGAIDNSGWELQASITPGPLSFSASLALVDSRVRRVASDYSGDLAPGDRMLEVPARTFGVSAGWTTRRIATSWSLTRASDWINYDRLALAQAVANAKASGGTTPPPIGPQLRAFWRTYDGVTRLGGRLTLSVLPRVGLTIVGENLLGQQLGEPDNLTVVPGRTVRVGVKTSF